MSSAMQCLAMKPVAPVTRTEDPMLHPLETRGGSACRLRLLLLLACGDAGLVLFPLGADVPIDQLDHRAGCTIAETVTGLEHTGVAAVPVLVARSENLEKLLDHLLVPQPGCSQPPRIEVAPLGERDVPIHHAPQVLGLGQRRNDLLVADKSGRHVGEHRLAMPTIPAELPAELPVSHRLRPLMWLLRGGSLASPLVSQ